MMKRLERQRKARERMRLKEMQRVEDAEKDVEADGEGQRLEDAVDGNAEAEDGELIMEDPEAEACDGEQKDQ